MNVDALKPRLNARVLFKLSMSVRVPKDAGCYVLTTFDGTILYIGLTESLKRRFEEHLDNKQKIKLTDDGAAFWFYFMKCSSGKLAFYERSWLEQFRIVHGRLPVLNKASSPVS